MDHNESLVNTTDNTQMAIVSCEVTFNQFTNFLHFNTTCVDDEYQIQAVEVINVFFVAAFLIIGALSIISNLFCLGILAWTLQAGQNSVLISLACCDLLAGVNMVSAKLQHGIHHFWSDNANSGPSCILTACLYVLAYGGQNSTMLLLTIERWISINYPLRCRVILNEKKINALIIAIWTFWLILAGCSTHDNKWTVGSGCHPFTVFRSWATMAILAPIMTAFFTIMVVYFLIHRVVRKHTRAIRDVSQITTSVEDQLFIHEAKSLRVLQYILGLFYGSWLALLVREGIKRIPTHSFETALAQFFIKDFLSALFLSSSALNTIVYNYRCKAFRDAMLRTLFPKRHREEKRLEALNDLGIINVTS